MDVSPIPVYNADTAGLRTLSSPQYTHALC
jgi:hypothetical protein